MIYVIWYADTLNGINDLINNEVYSTRALAESAAAEYVESFPDGRWREVNYDGERYWEGELDPDELRIYPFEIKTQ